MALVGTVPAVRWSAFISFAFLQSNAGAMRINMHVKYGRQYQGSGKRNNLGSVSWSCLSKQKGGRAQERAAVEVRAAWRGNILQICIMGIKLNEISPH